MQDQQLVLVALDTSTLELSESIPRRNRITGKPRYLWRRGKSELLVRQPIIISSQAQPWCDAGVGPSCFFARPTSNMVFHTFDMTCRRAQRRSVSSIEADLGARASSHPRTHQMTFRHSNMPNAFSFGVDYCARDLLPSHAFICFRSLSPNTRSNHRHGRFHAQQGTHC